MMLSGWRRSGRCALALCLAVGMGACGRGTGGGTATLVVTSAPVADAQVWVGGEQRGQAPVTVPGLAPGDVVVVLEKEGFRRTAKTVTIPEGGGVVNREIQLDPLVGYVTFKSIPSPVKVYLDGAYAGDTPLARKEVAVGEHTFEYRLDNYKPVSQTLTIEADYQYSPVLELKPLPAEISVISTPSGAEVTLNEEPQGTATPAKFSVVPGTYIISVYLKGYVTGEQSVELGPNEKRVAEIALSAGSTPPGMVLVPAGKFIMGADGAAPDERPQHVVEMKAFYMDKYEVTNEAYKKVFPSHAYEKGQDRYPAAGISFNEAKAYADAVGKRLPTEDEWERAARGTDGREYPWGKDFDKSRCNADAAGAGAPRKVGEFRGGMAPCGCMDMAGNVYEWTWDWYNPYPGNPDVTVQYGQRFRVLRGGSFRSSPFEARCVRRHYDKMDAERDDYGFRCAKDVQ